MKTEECPVCGREMEDQRHVGVECFYDVNEAVPSAKKGTIFQEVDGKSVYWGVTQRYRKGTRDKWIAKDLPNKNGIKQTSMKTKQVPIKPIRLLEKSIYTVACCKACRADFLAMMGRWARGELVTDEGEGEVLVRELGTNKRISREEWEARRVAKSPDVQQPQISESVPK